MCPTARALVRRELLPVWILQAKLPLLPCVSTTGFPPRGSCSEGWAGHRLPPGLPGRMAHTLRPVPRQVPQPPSSSTSVGSLTAHPGRAQGLGRNTLDLEGR